MENFVGKLAASCVLLGACFMAHAQGQYDYRPMPTGPVAPARQAHPQQQQPQQQYRPLPEFNEQPSAPAPDASHYDPRAGNHKFQHRQGGFLEGIRHDVNPCGTNGGFILDGWHDMGLLMTVKSWQFWLMCIFLFAAATFFVEGRYYRQLITNIREATAAALLLAMNDRAYAVIKTNEAVERHNRLVAKLDEQGLETRAQARIEMNAAMRSAALQAAELNDESDDSDAVPHASTHGPVVLLAATAPVPEPVMAQTVNQETQAVGSAVSESDSKNEQGSGDGQRMATFTLGSEKYKIPNPVHLHILSINRKTENLRSQIRNLEDRLKQYGEQA
jgi:hypothetical protein